MSGLLKELLKNTEGMSRKSGEKRNTRYPRWFTHLSVNTGYRLLFFDSCEELMSIKPA